MNGQLSINPYLIDYVPRDYAGRMPAGEVKLDCSLGVNGNLLGDHIFERLHGFRQRQVLYTGKVAKVVSEGNDKEIKFYPRDEELKSALAEWYQRHGVGEGWLTGNHFILGNGSYDILCAMNLLCLTRGRTVMGHAPQFSAYIDHVNCSGSRYDACYLSRESNYAFSADQYLAQMSGQYEMFIVENPINPTGQMTALADVERIAKRACELGKVLVVDEAYGEYIPFSESAINLVNRFPNVVTTRSFSKGWGMAGLRLGYAVAAAGGVLLENLKKLVLAFNGNALARTLALCAVRGELEAGEMPFSPEEVIADKRRVLQGIERFNQKYGRTLKVAVTYEMSPIMLLYCEPGGGGFDLHRHLMRTGLLTMSCGAYAGLDQTCVRLMLPPTEQIGLLLELLEQSIRTLPV